jgi:hypothetical protein
MSDKDYLIASLQNTIRTQQRIIDSHLKKIFELEKENENLKVIIREMSTK